MAGTRSEEHPKMDNEDEKKKAEEHSQLLWDALPGVIQLLQKEKEILNDQERLALSILEDLLKTTPEKPKLGFTKNTSFEKSDQSVPEPELQPVGVSSQSLGAEEPPNFLPTFVKGLARIQATYNWESGYSKFSIDVNLTNIIGEMNLPEGMPSSLEINVYLDNIPPEEKDRKLPSFLIDLWVEAANSVTIVENHFSIPFAEANLPTEKIEEMLLNFYSSYQNVTFTPLSETLAKDIPFSVSVETILPSKGEKKQVLMAGTDVYYNLGRHSLNHLPTNSLFYLRSHNRCPRTFTPLK